MTLRKAKLFYLIVTLILFSLVWANVNLFYYAHTHTDENGHLIFHAHPYQKTNEKDTPVHTHSKTEYILLGIIYEIMSLFMFSGLLFISLLSVNPILKPVIFHQNPFRVFFCKCNSRRAPPLCLSFS
jgi:hypothetical protein